MKNKSNIFEFEGYQVLKLKDLKKELTTEAYNHFVEFLKNKTLAIDENADTLVFYSDYKSWLHKKDGFFQKSNNINI